MFQKHPRPTDFGARYDAGLRTTPKLFGVAAQERGRLFESKCLQSRARIYRAKPAYTHSTAPNRRYPDLIAQRLLKAALNMQAPPYTIDELTTLARHCTDQEHNAAKVERQVAKSAAALLLASRIGARFDAIVTGAADKGTWVRISGPATEGRVVRGFQGLDVGDRVRVTLVHTDVTRGFIDFAAVPQKR